MEFLNLAFKKYFQLTVHNFLVSDQQWANFILIEFMSGNDKNLFNFFFQYLFLQFTSESYRQRCTRNFIYFFPYSFTPQWNIKKLMIIFFILYFILSTDLGLVTLHCATSLQPLQDQTTIFNIFQQEAVSNWNTRCVFIHSFENNKKSVGHKNP